ncbi:hypothetical protein KFE25_004079 [Diacronema lutheri]|uniref:Uncharacterized protein n=2 Tax=Diacronema lutheri TaxID=2081491 RepID=A0A8J6CA80_DIALT|nr:hypothetical protein KFE25_004079 [Diacronema lutheri]
MAAGRIAAALCVVSVVSGGHAGTRAVRARAVNARSQRVRSVSEGEPPRFSLGGAPSAREEDGDAARPSAARARSRAPIGSRATLSWTDAGTLLVDIPAEIAVSDNSSSVAIESVASAAVLAVVGRFTAAALGTASVGAVAFTVPFWIVGVELARDRVVVPLLRQSVSIGAHAYFVRWQLPGGWTVRERSGATADLQGVELLRVPREDHTAECLALFARGNQRWLLGCGLGADELRFLCEQLNAHIAAADAHAKWREERRLRGPADEELM